MRLALPYELRSSSAARSWIRSELADRGLPADTVEDAVSVAGELMANALRHAVPLPDGTIRLEATVNGRRVRVAVTDGGAEDAPSQKDATPEDTAGRGLSIVDTIAVAWGHHRDEDGLTVWAELTVPPPADQLPAAGSDEAAPDTPSTAPQRQP